MLCREHCLLLENTRKILMTFYSQCTILGVICQIIAGIFDLELRPRELKWLAVRKSTAPVGRSLIINVIIKVIIIVNVYNIAYSKRFCSSTLL